MKLVKYSVTLKRLTTDELELLRVKRNEVRHLMEYQEYITPEMQLKWFESINNRNNFYYIIEYQNEKIGLINQKDVSHDQNTMNSGLFLFDEKYYQSFIPVCASLMLIEIGFYIFATGPSYIQVMHNNQRAINYNKSLGYVLCNNQEKAINQRYILTKENFEKHAARLQKAALTLSSGDTKLYIILSPGDYKSGIGQFYEDVMQQLPHEFKLKMEGEDHVYFVDFKGLIV